MKNRIPPSLGPHTAPPRRLTRLALLALLLALPAALAYAASPPGLRIANKTYDPATGELGYELRNDTDQVITAWRLSLAAGDSMGRGQSSKMDQDFYMGLDAEAPIERILEPSVRQGPLYPGQSLAATWQVDLGASAAAPAALSIRAISWLFADASHGGSTEAAAELMEARTARLEQIETLLEELRAAGLGTRPTPSRRPWVDELVADLRRAAEPSSLEASLGPAAAAVLSATRVDLADSLEITERAAAAEPVRAPEIYRDLESDLERELSIGRPQLGPSIDH